MDEMDCPSRSQGARDAPDDLALVLPAAIADRTRRTVWQDAIDDHVGYTDVRTAEGSKPVLALRDRHGLRQQHPMKCRSIGVTEERAGQVGLFRKQCDQAVGGFG